MATLKKLKSKYELYSSLYADIACNLDLKGIDRLNDQAEASRAVAVDAFNAYLDELKQQEKIKRTREALNRVMEWKLDVLKRGLFGHPAIINHQATDLLRKIRNR